jgi:threonine aldolase
VGVIAAAALVALENERDRLPEDHRLARRLAEELAGIRGLRVDPGSVETNILFATFDPAVFGDASTLHASLREKGVLVGAASVDTIRLVAHADVGWDDMARALDAFRTSGRK